MYSPVLIQDIPGSKYKTILVTPSQLATSMGVSMQTINKWKEAGLETFDIGGTEMFDIGAATQWIVSRMKERYEHKEDIPPVSVEQSDATDWATEYKKEKAIGIKMENARRRGLLVDADIVRQKLLVASESFKTRASNVERTFGKQAGNAIRQIVESVCKDLEGV